MILNLLRIPITLAFAYTFYRALTGGTQLGNASIVALAAFGLLGSIFMALLWAPVVGEKVSGPVTGMLVEETSMAAQPKLLVQWISMLQRRGYHRLALGLIFIEGLRAPNLPHPALLGLGSAKPGSFLERCFAREVYRYNNIQNCLYAYSILKERHGKIPPPHPQPEVNLAILSLTRERPPEPNKIPLKASGPTPKPPRNRRIRLFSR
jgi:hypothetical protein